MEAKLSPVTKTESEMSFRNKARDVDSILKDVMRAYMNLELSGIGNDEVFKVAEALRSNNSVTSVNLSFCTGIFDSGVEALGRALMENESVAALNLSGCSNITDPGGATLVGILENHPSLRSLSLSAVREIGDLTLKEVARTMDHSKYKIKLSALNVAGCHGVSDLGLQALGEALMHNISLEALQIQGCIQVTDVGIKALASALGQNASLHTIDASWCEEVGDVGVICLADAIHSNYALHTLKLSCCLRVTDGAVKAIARALEHNSSLTHLDLSWCSHIGEDGLAALTSAMQRNRSMTRISLTGCKCIADPPDRDKGTHSSACQQQPMLQLSHFLQLNSKRPKSLAASALASVSDHRRKAAGADPAREHRRGRGGGEKSDLLEGQDLAFKQQEDHVRRTLRVAIINGAAMYNAEDAEGCLKMFVQTAETLLALTRSQVIANAITRAGGGGRPIRDRIWVLRSAFDALLDELGDGDEDLTVAGDPVLVNSRFGVHRTKSNQQA